MKQIAILMCLAAGIAAVSAADQRIAFQRDDSVFVSNLDGSVIRKLGDGILPAISPDGKSVAFTAKTQSGRGDGRRIGVIDIAAGTNRVFTDIPSDSMYYPSWSRDGRLIAFTLEAGKAWNLGLTNTDGGGFRMITKGEPGRVALFSPC